MSFFANNFVLTAFSLFLIVNVVVGIYYGRGITNIKEYALGNRDFSLAVMVSTITATMMGGGDLLITTYEVYKTGLFYAIAACLGILTYQLLVAQFFVPRMGEFLGSLSIADALGNIYGKNVRVISALSAAARSVAHVAIQFKVLSAVFAYVFPIQHEYATILAAGIVIVYSSFGGIKSIALTDLLQFFTFLVTIPMLLIVVWGHYSTDTIALARPTAEIFNINNFIGFDNPQFWELVALLALFALPGFSPALFQRISVGRSVIQVKKAFTISAFIFFVIMIISSFIAYMVYYINPELNIETEKYAVIYYIMDNYANPGILSIFLIGIAAMGMSTADSYLHSASIITAHDLFFQFKTGLNDTKKLIISKIFSISLGLASVIFAIYSTDLLSMLFWALKLEVVSIPIILTALGFRTTARVILTGMMAGVIVIFLWELGIVNSEIESVLPSRLVAAITIIAFHYILGEEGGWIGIKDKVSYNSIVGIRKRNIEKSISNVKNFNFIEFCKKTAPENDFTYTGLGIFILVSTLATMYTLSVNLQENGLLMQLVEFMLVTTFVYISYPIWPPSIKKEIVLQVLWYPMIFIILSILGTFFLIKSNFIHLQTIVFTTNILVTLILVRGKLGLSMVTLGSLLGIIFFKFTTGKEIIIPYEINNSLIYLGLIISCIFLIFLQPKFKKEKISQFLNQVLNDKLEDQSIALLRLSALKQELASRIDDDCREIFYDLKKRIENLSNKMNSSEDIKYKDYNSEITYINNKLITGSEYLVSLINEIEQSLRLKASIDSTGSLMKQIIEIVVSLNPNVELKHDLKIDSSQQISCDYPKINKVIKGLISDGLKRGFDNKKSSMKLSIMPTTIKYDLDFTDLFQESVKGVKINIEFLNINLPELEVDRLNSNDFSKEFSYWFQVIFAHYGRLNITPEKNKLTYIISIPLSLSEVRPKKMDLPDRVGQLFSLMHDAIQQQDKDTKTNILKRIVESGIDYDVAYNIVYGNP